MFPATTADLWGGADPFGEIRPPTVLIDDLGDPDTAAEVLARRWHARDHTYCRSPLSAAFCPDLDSYRDRAETYLTMAALWH